MEKLVKSVSEPFENNENLSSNIVELSYYFKKTKWRKIRL